MVIIQLIRRHRLREEYALVWLMAGAAILVLSVFGGLVRLLASLVDVSYPPTLVLVVGLLFALVILLSQSVTISGQANRLRDLAQTVALLERRLRQVEQGDAGKLANWHGNRSGTESCQGQSVQTSIGIDWNRHLRLHAWTGEDSASCTGRKHMTEQKTKSS